MRSYRNILARCDISNFGRDSKLINCRTNKSVAIITVSLIALSFSFLSESTLHHHTTVIEPAQPSVGPVKHRDLTIDLGSGLKTNAQLTIPAIGEGPFPGVLLIHGSGANDMNETGGLILVDNKTGSKI